MACRGMCKTCMDGPSPNRCCVSCYQHGVGQCVGKDPDSVYMDAKIDLTLVPGMCAWTQGFECKTRVLVENLEQDQRLCDSLESLSIIDLHCDLETKWFLASRSDPHHQGPYGLIERASPTYCQHCTELNKIYKSQRKAMKGEKKRMIRRRVQMAKQKEEHKKRKAAELALDPDLTQDYSDDDTDDDTDDTDWAKVASAAKKRRIDLLCEIQMRR
jgi:hypothetical protein